MENERKMQNYENKMKKKKQRLKQPQRAITRSQKDRRRLKRGVEVIFKTK